MLVYSRRDAFKPETISLSPRTKASNLPHWVKETLDEENDNFDAWNRGTVSRKVCCLLCILTRQFEMICNFLRRRL